jgi:DNA-binding response OmpR family regulator
MNASEHIRVVVIEDNHDLNSMLVKDIEAANYDSMGFLSVEAYNLSAIVADIIILDINLNGENGFEFASDLRKQNQDVYIIALTARAGRENRVTGYSCGIDVYLEKPMGSIEVLAVIKRCAERVNHMRAKLRAATSSGVLTLQGHVLGGAENKIILKNRELDLLLALIAAQDHMLSYENCLEAMHDPNMKQSALEVFIGRLRQKIRDASGIASSIQNIRGSGYLLAVKIDIIPDHTTEDLV